VAYTWTGTVTDGSLSLTLYNNNENKDGIRWNGISVDEAGTFQTDVLDFSAASTVGAGLDLSAAVGNNIWFQWDLNANNWSTSEPFSIWSDNLAVQVPEPSTFALLFGLIAALGVVYHRRR